MFEYHLAVIEWMADDNFHELSLYVESLGKLPRFHVFHHCIHSCETDEGSFIMYHNLKVDYEHISNILDLFTKFYFWWYCQKDVFLDDSCLGAGSIKKRCEPERQMSIFMSFVSYQEEQNQEEWNVRVKPFIHKVMWPALLSDA